MSQPARKATRRRRDRRIPTPLLWLATIACGGLIAWASFELLVRVVHPYQLGDQQARKVADLKARLERQEARNADLRRELEFLQSDEGAETLARSEGYHKPGEKVYMIAPNP
jgi:cell division protein FtsB